MQALRREEEQRSHAMAQKMAEIAKDITSVSQQITALEEELDLDGVSLLHVSLKDLLRCHHGDIKHLQLNLFFFFFPLRIARRRWRGPQSSHHTLFCPISQRDR